MLLSYANQMINNKLQIGHGKRKPSQFALGSIRHILYDRGLCVVWRTIQYIAKVANKSYSVSQAAATATGAIVPRHLILPTIQEPHKELEEPST